MGSSDTTSGVVLSDSLLFSLLVPIESPACKGFMMPVLLRVQPKGPLSCQVLIK